MAAEKGFIHPYVPNAAPGPRARLLAEIGVADVADLYASIPEALKLKGPLDLPPALPAEADLRRHVEGLLAKNRSCRELLNFRGAGCWQHYVPAICDEITGRGEFLTAYAGGTYSDHGKNQALFEFQSMMAELVDMEVVSAPTYDWGAAANSAVLMACRLTGRDGVLVPQLMSAERLSQMQGFTKPVARITALKQEPASGLIDLADLEAKLSDEVAAVYFDVPAYLGMIEHRGVEIAALAHAKGAMVVVGVDPISLGVLAPPGQYGADLVVGDLQPLGIHMYAGGGCGGFVASRDEERIVREYPMIMLSAAPGQAAGEVGYGWSTMERTSYDKRHESTDYYGTTQWVWGIGAGVYLALMGPKSLKELGEGIMQRACYAAQRIAGVKGVALPFMETPFFKEFVVNFDGTGKTVADINAALRERDILGGVDLSREHPALGQAALYCVTEVHGKDDIDRLVAGLEEACR